MAAPVCIFVRSAPRHSGRALGVAMHAPALTAKQRLLVATTSTLFAVWFYVMASARAVARGGYNLAPQLFHPWESPLLTVGILCFCIVSGIASAPIFRRGTVMRRVGVVSVLALPGFMLAHFVFVIVHAAIWAARELTTP